MNHPQEEEIRLPKCVWGCFINKNQINILNDGRHTRTSGNSKSAIDLTIASSSLQPILSSNVTDSPLCADYCMITVNIQSKNFEPKLQSQNSTSIKQTGTSLHQMKAWKELAHLSRSQSAEALTKDMHKKSKFPQDLIKENDSIRYSGIPIASNTSSSGKKPEHNSKV